MQWLVMWLLATLTVRESVLLPTNETSTESAASTEPSRVNDSFQQPTSTIGYEDEINIPLPIHMDDRNEGVLAVSTVSNIILPKDETSNPETSSTNEESNEPSNRPEQIVSAESLEAETEEIVTQPEAPDVDESSAIVSRSVEETGHLVQTNSGPVQGHLHETIVSFYDIPYARFDEPFQTPATNQPWLDVHDRTFHEKRCPQLKDGEYVGDLDCLTLSIFTPEDVEDAGVLFHIHDPRFHSADPSIYGPKHLVSRGVILVVPNYRFGVVGFLCMHNSTAPGNAGLKDLSHALRWVKENIRNFGGDPDNLVVSGDGEGAALAGYLALNSQTKNQLSKAITESGTVLSPWALDRSPLTNAILLANKIREESQNDSIDGDLFAAVDIATIVTAAKDISFHPCLETNEEITGAFVKSTPWEELHDSKSEIIFMSGCASYAGLREALSVTEASIETLNENFGSVLPGDLGLTVDERFNLGLRVKEQYFGNSTVTDRHLEELSLYYTDALYLGPLVRFARPVVEMGGKVFLYEFDFVGTLNIELEALNRPLQGAARSDMISYLFHREGTEVEDESPEQDMIDLMVDFWTSFIKEGHPTSEGIAWVELAHTDEDSEEWLRISSEPRAARGVHVDRLRLWTSLYYDHYVDRSPAINNKSNYFVPFIAILILWISNPKFNYKCL